MVKTKSKDLNVILTLTFHQTNSLWVSSSLSFIFSLMSYSISATHLVTCHCSKVENRYVNQTHKQQLTLLQSVVHVCLTDCHQSTFEMTFGAGLKILIQPFIYTIMFLSSSVKEKKSPLLTFGATCWTSEALKAVCMWSSESFRFLNSSLNLNQCLKERNNPNVLLLRFSGCVSLLF